MKIFLIVVGCILLYIIGVFVTFTLTLYIDRCVFESTTVYEYMDGDDIEFAFFWPLTIWFVVGYILYMKLKKLSIAIVETLYQVNHKEDEDEDE